MYQVGLPGSPSKSLCFSRRHCYPLSQGAHAVRPPFTSWACGGSDTVDGLVVLGGLSLWVQSLWECCFSGTPGALVFWSREVGGDAIQSGPGCKLRGFWLWPCHFTAVFLCVTFPPRVSSSVKQGVWLSQKPLVAMFMFWVKAVVKVYMNFGF